MTNFILLNAILSMDAYNRGYGAGIDLRPRNKDGSLKLDTNGIPVASDAVDAANQIGNVSVFQSKGDTSAQDAGFYAIAYQDNASKEITISYRGTDNPVGLKGNDFINGWIGGAGFITSQDGLAFAFYNDVAKQQNNNTAIDPRNAQVSLTGHSLGGGLAGLAAANDNHRATKSRVA